MVYETEDPVMSFHVWIPQSRLKKFRELAVEVDPDERNWARVLGCMIDTVHGNAKIRKSVVEGAKKNG